MRRHYGRLCARSWPMARPSSKEASPVGNPKPRDWIAPLWCEWLFASRPVECLADVMRKVSTPHDLVQARKGLSRHASSTVDLLTLFHPALVFGLSRTRGVGALSLIQVSSEPLEGAGDRCSQHDGLGFHLHCCASYRSFGVGIISARYGLSAPPPRFTRSMKPVPRSSVSVENTPWNGM
jgi:hypothetical protein